MLEETKIFDTELSINENKRDELKLITLKFYDAITACMYSLILFVKNEDYFPMLEKLENEIEKRNQRESRPI